MQKKNVRQLIKSCGKLGPKIHKYSCFHFVQQISLNWFGRNPYFGSACNQFFWTRKIMQSGYVSCISNNLLACLYFETLNFCFSYDNFYLRHGFRTNVSRLAMDAATRYEFPQLGIRLLHYIRPCFHRCRSLLLFGSKEGWLFYETFYILFQSAAK